MKVTTIGLDLAKTVFQAHGADERGKRVFSRQIKRAQLIEFFAKLTPCLVGMEACASAHYWARRLQQLGHTVRLIAPQLVKPYVKTNKHDAADAEAICEAVTRPNMRFVAIKSPEQQEVMALHALRAGAMKARNALSNRLRGLLMEFGVFIPKGLEHVRKQVPAALDDAANELPAVLRVALHAEYEQMKLLHEHIERMQQLIGQWHQASAPSRQLQRIPGIGTLTASALVGCMGDAREFANAAQASAWVGIVPRQESSGGKTRLLGISKRGDSYVRTLLIHGARSVLCALKAKVKRLGCTTSLSRQEQWLWALSQRRNANVAAVALANKNMRIAWALLAHGRPYEPDHVSLSPRARAPGMSGCAASA
jgi:transposase